jgi:hypothetical protein
MLNRTPSSERPAVARAESGGRVVRFFGRHACPHCGGELRPSDMDLRPDGQFLICSHCHQDVQTVTAS